MPSMINNIPTDAINITLLQAGELCNQLKGSLHSKISPCIIIAQAYQGSYEVHSRGKQIITTKNEAFLAATNDPLNIYHHGDPKKNYIMKARWLHMHITLFNTLDFSSLIDIPMKCDESYGKEFAKIIRELLKGSPESQSNSFYWPIRKQELGFKALALLCKISPPKANAEDLIKQTQRLIPVFTYIKENLHNHFSASDLADIACMSVSRFHAFFKAQTQTTPMEYVKNVRLTEASHRLLTSDQSIVKIASALGFGSPFHLSREFRKKFKQPPTAYRKHHQLF